MISANQYTVADVLGDKFIHEIPSYQRPYAWTSDEAMQLFEDLEQAVQASPTDPYFLGSIVLIRSPGELVGHVVDGQQRLTTLTILAAVLRDLADDERERSALAHAVYIEPNPFRAQQEAVRIRAHNEDRVFFREAIQVPGATAHMDCPQKPKSEAQILMWGNAMAMRKRIAALPPTIRQSIVTFLLNRCIIVVVATESKAAALRIFRVLNDRGMDLSNADIIKADLLDRFKDPEEQRHQAARWRATENDLGREDFEFLLEHLRFIREKVRGRTTLSDAYASRFKEAAASDVRAFLDNELSPAKLWYTCIVDGDGSSFSDDIRGTAVEALAGLRLLPNKDWVSAALAISLKYGWTDKTAQSLLKLEGLAWSMQLARRYDTQRLNRYATVIKALEDGEDALQIALSVSLSENYSACTALVGPLYAEFPTRVVRALLERLDRLLAEQPVLWNGQITVEHILPQNPAPDEWIEFDSMQRADFTHKIGNLVLLTKRKNSSASNYDFLKKRDVYFGLGSNSKIQKRATYASAQELSHLAHWNPEEFSKRHQHHIQVLASRWGLNINQAEPTSEEL